jgi:DNA-binding NtrC family response regulator
MARVLIIDDEEQVRKLIGEVLEEAGHEVVEARNGREGMKLYEANPADLVITDLVMPEQEGLETITGLRRRFPAVKIIAISGAQQKLDLDLLYVAEKLGALRTLEKPFEMQKLVALVEELLQVKP